MSKQAIALADLPVVHGTGLRSADPAGRQQAAAYLCKAARDTGFPYGVGHGDA